MNKKRWQRLKFNQYAWVKVVFSLWIMCLLLECLRYIIIKDNSIIIKMVAMLVIGVVCIATTHLKIGRIRKVSNLMEHFIKKNGLYQSHHIKQEDKKQTIEKIDYYPCVSYMEDKKNNAFYIKVRLDGTMIAERFRDMEQALADMFSTICTEKILERGYLTYSFELSEQKQAIIETQDDIMPVGESEIAFSSDIIWNWKKSEHLLLIGDTGSGKTFLAQYIISCLLSQGVRVIYCDAKNDDDMRFFIQCHPSVKYVTKENEIVKVVRETEEEVRARERDLQNIGIQEAEFNPVFLFFDELIAFSKIAEKKTYEDMIKRLSVIIVTGRSKRIYGGMILQRPDTSYIDGSIRDNLGCRICMGQMSETAYQMAYGHEFSKVKNHRHDIGSGLIFRKRVDTKPREFVAPFIKQGALNK